MAQYEVTLRDYWRILRRRKGIVAFTALLLGLFSFLIASVWQPLPLYEAAAKVQINLHQNLTGLYLQTIAYNSGDEIETQQAIITSHAVLRRAGEALRLFDWAVTPEDTAIAIVGLQLQISTLQEGYTNIVAISAENTDPLMARDLANTVARVYREYDHELKNQQAVRHREFVEGQRTQARRALEAAEEGVRQYREDTDIISLDSQASVNLQQITATETQAQVLRQDISAIGAMVDEMERGGVLSEQTLKGVSRSRVGDTFVARSGQLTDLRLQRDALLVQFTADHPSVVQVQVKMDQLLQDLQQELVQRRSSLSRDLKAANARLDRLRREYNQLPSLGLRLSRFEREVMLRQEIVTALEESYQEALIREADKVDEVTVLQWALTPSAPVNPHHPLKRAIMGLLLGLILGVVFAVVAETLDTSIGTIEDVQEYTGSQVVGVVPFINVDDVRASLDRRGVDVSDERAVQRKSQLVAYFDPQSTLAESYRTLRTNIEFVTVEKGARCIMATSSMHGEGKSTTLANLSMMMAQLGKRTLLVDCDLRKPSLARLFGLDKEPGVTEVIVGNYAWSDVVRTVTDIVTGGVGMEDILQTQGIGNLNIITSGSIPPNPSELLNSRRMGEFVREVRDAYDVVLFDSPPVLQVTDAAILGKMMDGTLMVYKVGDIARTSLRRSTSLLQSVEIDVLGIILNGIRAELSSDYQDLGYSAYYAYGTDADTPARDWRQRTRDWAAKWTRRAGADAGEAGPESLGPQQQASTRREEYSRGTDTEDSGRGVSGAVRLAAYGALLATALGLVWQSGYLDSPLGLIPVSGQRLSGEWEESRPPGTAAAVPEPVQAPRPGPAELTGGSPELALADKSATEAPPVAAVTGPPRSEPDPAARLEGYPIVPVAQAYVVRVASYPPGSRWARQSLNRLRQAGELAYFTPVESRGQVFNRLLVGRFASWDQAYRHARELQEQGTIEEFSVLRLPYALDLGQYDTPEAAALAAGASDDTGWYAQIQEKAGGYAVWAGAFGSVDGARVLKGMLAGAGQPPADTR